MYTIAKYIRLSQDDSRSDSQSIENQRLLLDKHLETLDIPEANILEFVDNGYTGTNFNRPGMQSLLALAQTQKIQCIMVKDFSRFGRNALETGYYLERIFPLYGVRFISLADGYDSLDYKEDTGGLLVSFKFLMAEYYSKDLSPKITSAARERMKRGERISKRCAFGYRKEGDNLVPDGATAPTVERIFNLVEQGVSTKEIIAILQRERHPTPSACHGKQLPDDLSCIWTRPHILTILRNEQYIGTYVAGKTRQQGFGDKKQIQVPESHWIKIPNHHQSIIPEEQFWKVQRLLHKPKRKPNTAISTTSIPSSPLANRLYCGHCGHKMKETRGEHKGFACKFTLHSLHSPCHKLSIPLEKLEQEVMHQITEQEFTLQEEPEPTSQNLDLDLYEAFVQGKIDIATYQAQKATIPKPQIIKKEPAPPPAEEQALTKKSLTPELVERWIEKIFYFPDKHIKIIWKEQFPGGNRVK